MGGGDGGGMGERVAVPPKEEVVDFIVQVHLSVARDRRVGGTMTGNNGELAFVSTAI